MEKIRAHVYVDGLVQGVFFRASTRSAAIRQGVTGWVRNLYDGRVEAVFEGEADKVAAMVKYCEIGPPGARVRDCEVLWEKYSGEFTGFAVRY
jgi:acylphosphatase